MSLRSLITGFKDEVGELKNSILPVNRPKPIRRVVNNIGRNTANRAISTINPVAGSILRSPIVRNKSNQLVQSGISNLRKNWNTPIKISPTMQKVLDVSSGFATGVAKGVPGEQAILNKLNVSVPKPITTGGKIASFVGEQAPMFAMTGGIGNALKGTKLLKPVLSGGTKLAGKIGTKTLARKVLSKGILNATTAGLPYTLGYEAYSNLNKPKTVKESSKSIKDNILFDLATGSLPIVGFGGMVVGKNALNYVDLPKVKGAFDNLPRAEVSDLSSRILKNADDVISRLKKQGETPVLADVLKHDSLFKSYPQLQNIKIDIDSTAKNILGSYESATNSIKIRPNMSRKELRSTLLHEVQHAIQEIEGFAKGGSPGFTVGQMGVYKEKLQSLQEQLMRKALKNKEYNKFYNGTLNRSNPDYKPLLDEIDELKRLNDLTPQQNYQRLGGEIEARSTQLREGMTSAQRKVINPYDQILNKEGIKREDVIVNGVGGADNAGKNELEDILKAQNSKIDPLIEEARKYKSAEEFVNKQTFYRGETGGTGNYFTRDQEFANEFANGKPLTEIGIPENLIYRPETLPEAVNEQQVTNAIKDAKLKGFKAVYISEGTPFGEPIESVFVFDKSAVKTKSQLTDIWNKAHVKGGDLLEEARKYKSAEEFVNKIAKTDDTVMDGLVRYTKKNGSWVQGLTGTKVTNSQKIALLESLLKGNKKPYDAVKDLFNDGELWDSGQLSSQQKQVLEILESKGFIEKIKGNPTENMTANGVADIWKPKSQLTDIWNKAQVKGGKSLSIKDAGKSYIGMPKNKDEAISKLRDMQDYPSKLSAAGYDASTIKGISYKESTKILDDTTLSNPKSPTFSEFEDSLRSNKVSPKNKVGILDALRTPEKVMEKIGLGKEMKAIRSSWEKYISDKNVELNRINEWYKKAPDQASSQAIFKYLDGQKIDLSDDQLKIAKEIKTYLKDWADKLELPEDKRISSYITHIWEKDVEGVDIDPDFAKLIAEKVPGSVYDPFVEKRIGQQGYVEDVWRALDAYVKRATRKVNMDPALSKLKGAAEFLDLQSYNYVKKYADAINMRPTNVESLIDNTIKSIIGYRATARPTSYLTSKWRKTVFRGALGLNIGSAVRNLTQGVNTYAKLGEKYTLLGYVDIAKKLGTKDGLSELKNVGVLDDSFVADRSFSAMKLATEKTDKVLFSLFDLAEKINRGSAYYGAKKKALAKGLSETDAIDYAKKIVRETQFTFGAIDTPQVLRSDVAKTLGQFQSFNLKQAEFLGEMVKSKDIAGLVRFTAGTLLVVASIGKLIGMDWKENIPFSDFITGDQKIANTPALQAMGGITDTALGISTGDDYKKSQGLDKLAKTGALMFPAGSQIKKTVQGIKAGKQGYSATKSGGARFLVPENRKIQSAIFGQYSTPEAQEYFKNNRRPLSANQTEALKKSTDKKATYDEIMKTRELNAQETKIREKVKESGKMQETEDKYIYWDAEKGETGSIRKNPDLTPPKLTGQPQLDKEKISDYKTKLSNRANDIVKLYELGLLTEEEAEKELTKIIEIKKSLKTTSGKAKKVDLAKISQKTLKPVKVSSKSPKFNTFEVLSGFNKVKAPNIEAPKLEVPKFELPKFEMPNFKKGK